MSKRKPEAAKSPKRTASERSSRPAPVGVIAGAAVLAIAAAGLGYALFGKARASGTPGVTVRTEGLSTANMLDSVRTHFTAHQWDAALAWAHASNVAEPGNARLLLNEALAWHNYAQDATQRWPGRSATRTSLDRIELEKHAFALLDSAEAVAGSDEEWANVRRWRGTQYEVLGLPLDAVQAYEDALARSPGHRATIERFGWLQRMIVRPSDPKSVTAEDAALRPR